MANKKRTRIFTHRFKMLDRKIDLIIKQLTKKNKNKKKIELFSLLKKFEPGRSIPTSFRVDESLLKIFRQTATNQNLTLVQAVNLSFEYFVLAFKENKNNKMEL